MGRGLISLPGLQRQVELRQLTIADLAVAAGISWTSARKALAGEPVSVQTFRRITEALAQIPIDPVAALALGIDSAELVQLTALVPARPEPRPRRGRVA